MTVRKRTGDREGRGEMNAEQREGPRQDGTGSQVEMAWDSP